MLSTITDWHCTRYSGNNIIQNLRSARRHRQAIGSFSMPQLLLSNHNNIQALPKMLVLELLQRWNFFGECTASSSGPKPRGALRAVSVCPWAHGSPLACFFSMVPDKWTHATVWGKQGLLKTFLFLLAGSAEGRGLALSFPLWLLHSGKRM